MSLPKPRYNLIDQSGSLIETVVNKDIRTTVQTRTEFLNFNEDSISVDLGLEKPGNYTITIKLQLMLNTPLILTNTYKISLLIKPKTSTITVQ